MACQIKRNSNGTIAQVLAPNGKDSILYQDLVTNLSNPQIMTMVIQDPYVNMVLGTEYVKDTSVEEVALAAWSKAYTTSFIEQFGNWKVKTIANTDVNGEPSVNALFSKIQASASFKLIQINEYTKYPQKYLEEVERVVRLIENKLRIKEKGFTGKVSDKFISKESYLADVLKNLLGNIGLPESITSLEELKTQLDSGDIVKYVKSQYDFYKEQASIAKEDLDNLNAKTRTLNSYLKVQDLSSYSKEQQSLIIKSFPALFEELGRYKSKKQALEHYKRIVNTPTFLNKILSSNIIKNKYFINQAKLNKFENLVNYNTLSPEDFNYRIYRVVENELNRRSDFFSSPKMQEVVLAEKEKIAKRNYENSVKGILERFSNNKNTVSGKIAEVFLKHPKTLSAIKSENIQRSIFGFAGGKWTGNGELEINYRNETSLRHILLHELTHHFTVPYIYTYLKNYSDAEKYIGFIERFPSKSELEENIQYSFQSLTSEEIKNISKLEDIYIHVLKLHKEGKLKFTNYEFSANPEYGLENFYEFISEVISNPYFASEIAKQPSLYNKKSNLLKDIIDMIFKMFGVNNPSLLDDIYSLFEETFLDKDVKYAFRDTVGGSITFPLETQPTVKEGIDFVFEQNPELANAVYEAAGFKSNLKTSLGKELEYKDPYVSTSRLKDFKQYQVLDEKGNDIGSVVIEYRGDKSVILHPKLNISGKGYGKDLYKLISSKFNVEIQEWNEGGISKSDSAKAMWDSLEREGSAKRIVDVEQGDNFRVLNYKEEITPQQKQQAQQLYSNYLDTVFPDSQVKDIVYHGTGKKDWKPFKGKNFFTDLESATNYANVIASEDLEFTGKIGETKVIPVVLNVNPEIVDKVLSIEEIDNYKTNRNGIVANVKEPIGIQKQFVVFEPEQIHILGTKQDIEGFKKYVQGKTQGSGMTKLLDLIDMKRWTQTKNNCPKL